MMKIIINIKPCLTWLQIRYTSLNVYMKDQEGRARNKGNTHKHITQLIPTTAYKEECGEIKHREKRKDCGYFNI